MSAPSVADQATQTALLALHSLHNDPDNAAKRRANDWLSEFQHTSEAWQTCHILLTAPNIDLPGRMLGAQTFRSKVMYDLHQLPPTQLGPLRDSFLQSLTLYSRTPGHRPVTTQLCLSLADLAYQMPEWNEAVQSMVNEYGQDPKTVAMLLEFLKVLVEEGENSRIPISSSQARDRSQALLSSQTDTVLSLLAMYMHATGVTTQIQTACFETLRAWLRSGEMSVSAIVHSPMFAFAFDSMANDELFDPAVDVICDLIHETQEVEDNMEVIQQIVPRVLALRPAFLEAKEAEDADRVRGLCRVFVEAGETYRQLVLQHPETFFPLVEAIGECVAFKDYDIIQITFHFWYKLSQSLGKRASDDPSFGPFLGIYIKLQDDIVEHLQFPADGEVQTAEERDEFREFRHNMGDVLKDCCQVLGANLCMKKSYDLIAKALSKPAGTWTWQEIEAPLFSMRSMGAEVDPADDEVLPHIMDLLPSLPQHNKIRYAAILVISRYTQWIDQHPSYLEFQLSYISQGFQIIEDDVSAAAAQAMKFLCEDCKNHLVPYLGSLYDFITGPGMKLPLEDRIEVSEAIGFVIGSMPVEQAAEALQRFCQPLIQIVLDLAETTVPPSKDEIEPTLNALEQLAAYLMVVHTLEPLPVSCLNSCSQIYEILDRLLAKYPTHYSISEKTCRLIRRGMTFFPAAVIQGVLPRLIERLVISFELSGHSIYLWIWGKAVSPAKKKVEGLTAVNEATLDSALAMSLDRVTARVKAMETTQSAREVPDVFEDYIHGIESYLDKCPQTIVLSSSLPTIFQLCLSAITLPSISAIEVGLESINNLLEISLKDAASLGIIQAIVLQQGQQLTVQMLHGLAQNYPENSVQVSMDLLRSLCQIVPGEVRSWASLAMQSLPGHLVPAPDKQDFLTTLDKAFAESDPKLIKAALRSYWRTARRTKERKDRTSLA